MSSAAISALERGSRRAPYRSTVDLLADGLGIEAETRNRLHALAQSWRKARSLPSRLAETSAQTSACPSPGNNLPSQISSFVGRKKELEDLSELISRCRLLTIVGPGGIGKTRLALQLAAEVLDRYRDGAWFVDLTALRNPEFIPQAVAAALNLRETPNEPVETTLLAGLREKTLLLIIDNAEHLLGGVAKLAKTILTGSPLVTLATTSREPLHLSGEQVYRLGPLSEAPESGNAAAIAQHDGTRLFLERAHEADPTLTLSDADYADINFLCRKLEGIPLAIELACARLSSMTLKQLANRLKSSLTLASKDSTETSRHRTLRETIAWSFQLLSSTESTALMTMAAFRGGCTVDAIRAVAISVIDVEDAIDSLVDKSLLQLEVANGEERYRLLDVVREYAYENLQASGECDAVARSLAMYYAGLTSAAYPKIDREAPNLRAAIEWSLAHDVQLAVRMVRDLSPYWRVRGAVTEARSWISRALEIVPSDEIRASLLCLAASFAVMQDELGESLRLSREALEIYLRTEGSRGAAEARFRIAEAEHRRGHLDVAETLYREALEGFVAFADSRGEMICLANLGMLSRQRGDVRRASALLRDAMQRAIHLGERRIVAECTMAMGWVELSLDDVAHARTLFERALAETRDSQDPYGECCARHGLATVALEEQRYEEAEREFLATLRSANQLWLRDYVARALHGIAAIRALQGDAETAARFLGVADRLFEESGRELRDSIAYDIAAQSIAATLPEPRRCLLLQEGALMPVSGALTIVEAM
jgi:predicted ATPase/Tfp pilus assembly protein PilF